jgi:hypothetical protein
LADLMTCLASAGLVQPVETVRLPWGVLMTTVMMPVEGRICVFMVLFWI